MNSKLELERIIFFSDAVFAIAITLLALNLKLPDQGQALSTPLSLNLWKLLPQLQSYVLSFSIIGIYWMAHHRYFRYIKRYDYRFVVLNIIFLMCIVFLPFPTSVLDNYQGQRSAVMFYAGSMALTGAMKALIWWYASRNHRLVVRSLQRRYIQRLMGYALIPPTIFLLSMAIAYFNPSLAKLSWLSIVVLLLLSKPSRLTPADESMSRRP